MEEAQRRVDEWVGENDTTKPLELGLTELPPLPVHLTELFCNNNKLTELPPLPAHLTELYSYTMVKSANKS